MKKVFTLTLLLGLLTFSSCSDQMQEIRPADPSETNNPQTDDPDCKSNEC